MTRERLEAGLADRYRIERELGHGGMATVYLADDLKHRRRVAIKVLRPELATAIGPERFLREIEISAGLHHPHIVALYDSGEAGGSLYYVMPFAEGESLRDRLNREKQLPLDDALLIAREVADALSYAHARGVVHRDIKPENILLESGHALVADFGIARALSAAGADRLTQTGVSIGTTTYMSPEQVAGDPDIDGRSDLYSLGCVLYEMLAGQPPFTGPTAEIVARQHLLTQAAPVTNLRPTVPPEVAAALARILAKNPADRLSPASQLVRVLAGEAPAPGTGRWWKTPRGIAVATAFLLILGAALVVDRWSARPGSGPAARSLAVLPFESVGGDTANTYFAEGLADELTTALSRVPGLRVAARTSAFTFRSSGADVRQVGRDLGVAAVLEGRVRRVGDRLRVVAQLTGTADGLLLWSNSYEREVRDVFAVQDDITRDIVGALRVTLAGGAAGPTAPDTRDLEAYDLYLRGRYFLTKRGGGVQQSIGYFEQAIARDSSYARAWAQLATAWALTPMYTMVPRDSALPRVREAASRAVRLDPSSSEAHAAAGMAWVLDSDGQRGLEELEGAIALDSTYSFSQLAAMSALAMLGRDDEAIAQGRRATAIDPLSPTIAAIFSRVLLFGRQFNEAVAVGRRAVELDSLQPLTRSNLASAEYFAGHQDEARDVARRSIWVPITSAPIAFVLAATGGRAEAEGLVRRIEAERGRNSYAETAIAMAWLGAGDTARALDALERMAAADGHDHRDVPSAGRRLTLPRRPTRWSQSGRASRRPGFGQGGRPAVVFTDVVEPGGGGLVVRGQLDTDAGVITGERSYRARFDDDGLTVPGVLTYRYTLRRTGRRGGQNGRRG